MDPNLSERSELQRKLKQFIIRQLVRPEEDLVRFFAAKVYSDRLSDEKLEWFTQITQEAIQEVFVKKQVADPSDGSQPRHLLIIEDDQEKREFGLTNPMYSIGRDPGCDICLASPFVSFHHATLVQLPKPNGDHYYRIVDGDLKGTTSANGFMINGKKVQAADLHHGDRIILGPQIQGTYFESKLEPKLTPPPESKRSSGDKNRKKKRNLPRKLAMAFSNWPG